jgi:uncharacterized membrane protein YeaQ/YmgE (transglycosylase-associated protein family)
MAAETLALAGTLISSPLARTSASTWAIEIIALIIGGLIVGALGRLIHPGPDPIGLLATLAIGVASLLIAGLLLGPRYGAWGFVLAVVIAVLIVTLISHRRLGRR